jgi:UDP-N-acetyl-2-amino-2-deoxyglucuronate dehydrogenase
VSDFQAVAPGKPLVVGIIGTGLSATMHLQALRSVAGVAVRAVVGTTAEKAAAFASQHGIPQAFANSDELIQRGQVDAIHLCTPPFAREQYVKVAARAGVHVLIEKPMARNVAEADRIIVAARAGGVTLGAMFQMRFMPLPQRIKAEIEAGKLGRIFLADCQAKWWREPAYYANSTWRGRRELEGGAVLINQAIHSIDLLQWLAGPVRRITGRVATAVHAIEMEDVAVATVEFASGAIGVIEASTATYPGFGERIQLHGDRGSLILNQGDATAEFHPRDGQSERFEASTQRGESARDPAKVSLVGHVAQLTDFYEAIRAGRPPLIDGAEARKALEIVEAIRLSSDRGGVPVSLPL